MTVADRLMIAERRIEELEAERDRLVAENAKVKADYEIISHDAQHSIEYALAETATAEAEVARLNATIERVRAVLEPRGFDGDPDPNLDYDYALDRVRPNILAALVKPKVKP